MSRESLAWERDEPPAPDPDIGLCEVCDASLERYNVVTRAPEARENSRQPADRITVGYYRCTACGAHGEVVRRHPDRRKKGARFPEPELRRGPALDDGAAASLRKATRAAADGGDALEELPDALEPDPEAIDTTR